MPPHLQKICFISSDRLSMPALPQCLVSPNYTMPGGSTN